VPNCDRERYILRRVWGDARREVVAVAHLVHKQFFIRANTALLLSIVWGGLAACAIGAMAYDIGSWLSVW